MISREHLHHHQAKRPHVTHHTVLASEQLWRGVFDGSASCEFAVFLALVFLLTVARHAEVGDLDIVSVEQNVAWF